MQYANRYKITVKPVADAVKHATELYMQFDYQQAADTLATALEQTEQGSYKKVEDAYLARKKASLYWFAWLESQPGLGLAFGLG